MIHTQISLSLTLSLAISIATNIDYNHYQHNQYDIDNYCDDIHHDDKSVRNMKRRMRMMKVKEMMMMNVKERMMMMMMNESMKVKRCLKLLLVLGL